VLLKSKQSILPPIHPNAGVSADYKHRLIKLIDEMHRSVQYWIVAAYRGNPPEIAQDALSTGALLAQDELPASVLRRMIRRLSRRWQKRFDEMGPKLAQYYATSADKRVSGQLQRILREGGIAMEFKLTRVARDAMKASVAEQVSLIRSIPQRYFTAIEGSVMRSVASGGDLKTLTDDLETHYNVTRRRAAFIARDQNAKAVAACTRARQADLGVTEAVWLHSHGGKTPRPKHLAFSGKRYKISEGAPIGDKGQMTWPGFEVNCRCVPRSIIRGFAG
jgi:SPP1 gp7 family putative phage head morphogenesis protein